MKKTSVAAAGAAVVPGAVLLSAVLLSAVLSSAVAAAAQSMGLDTATGARPAQTSDTAPTSVEPIECWWRTSASSVRIGELFSLVLTCAVLDSSSTTVVPDQSRLDPTVLQLPPFEVTGGAQAADLHTISRRFFQYEYTMRYIGEDFGRDVALPPYSITYRVQSRVEQNATAVESRDHQYILPAQNIRILSLVPATASDIRERAPDTFRGIEARRFRASVLRIVSVSLFGLGAVMLAWTLVRAVSRRRERTSAAIRLISDSTILREVARELDAVRRLHPIDGWTPELTSRASAALRIAGAYETTGHASQTPWSAGVKDGEGRLVVRSRLRPGRAAIISGSATATTLEREMHRMESRGQSTAVLDDLRLSLAAIDAVSYSRPDASTPDLDDALAAGTRAVGAVRREHRWATVKLKALARSVSGLRTRAWAR